MEESDGVCSTQTAAGSDTAEGTQNNTVLVQMEEEERAIRAMPFVTTLSFVRAVKGKAEGWRVTLTCFACREYNSCGKKQEASVHISGERPHSARLLAGAAKTTGGASWQLRSSSY
jgi:hypothetical protein